MHLESNRFSIEIELMSKLAKRKVEFHEIDVLYRRRLSSEGKKLRVTDGWSILWRLIKLR